MEIITFKKIINDYLWRVSQFAFKSIIPLFITFYGAKVLSPNEFGEVVYLLTVITIINLFTNFGISISALKSAAEFNNNNEINNLNNLLPSASRISLIVIVPISVIAFILLGDTSKYLLYTIPYLIFNPITSIIDGIYVGTKNFKRLAINTSFASLISFFCSIFLITKFQKQGILLSYSVYYILLFIFNYLKYPFKKGRFSLELSKEVLKYSVIIGLGSISFFLYSRFDILVLKYFGYTNEIGHYELIMKFFEVTFIPIVLVGQVLSPYFIKLKQEYKFNHIFNYFSISSSFMFILGVVASVILYLIIPYIIKEFYSNYFSEEFLLIMSILLFSVPFKFVGIYLTHGLINPLGYAKIITYTTLIFGIINIIMDIVCIKLFGFIGIFWVTLFVHNVNISLQFILFFRIVKKSIHAY